MTYTLRYAAPEVRPVLLAYFGPDIVYTNFPCAVLCLCCALPRMAFTY